jgi:DUF4097 and DUF4098 domain-containing protein YvlB
MNQQRPRRYSLFTGLLLIVLGVLFLANNLAPGAIQLSRLARYWPVLLILLGIAKLLDRLLARRTAQAPPRLLTPGEVLLLIAVIGGSIAAIGFASFERRHPGMGISTGLWGHTFTFSEELPTKELKRNASVAVSTPRGDITVRPGEVSGLRVIVTKKVAGRSWDRASAIAKTIQVNVEPTAQGYQIAPQLGEEAHNVQVNLETYLPAPTNLSALTDAGDIDIDGLNGAISATSNRGDVVTREAGGDLTVQVGHGDVRIADVKGNVRLTGRGDSVELGDIQGTVLVEGEFFGPVRIHDIARALRYTSNRTELTIGRLPGRLEMDSGTLTLSDTPADVRLVTRDRDIEFENVTGGIQIVNRNGKIEVRFRQQPREDVSITDDSGNVAVVLPAGINAQIAAFAHSGSVESEFEAPTLRKIQQGGNNQLEGTLGSGGPKISIITSYGTIHLEKAD